MSMSQMQVLKLEALTHEQCLMLNMFLEDSEGPDGVIMQKGDLEYN